MKKLLLSLITAFTIFGLSAQENMVFGPCRDNYSNISIQQANVTYTVAAKISGNVAKALKGNRLTGMEIAFGYLKQAPATFFIRRNLDDSNLYSQEFTVRSERYVELSLDTPFECDGEEFYIGYEFLCNNAYYTPVAVDMSANPFPDWCNLKTKAGDQESDWQNLSANFGNLCLRAVFEGDNLPGAILYPMETVNPPYAIPNQDFSVRMSLLNMGAKDVESFDVSYTNLSGELKTIAVNLDSPITPGSIQDVDVNGFILDNEAKNVNLNLSISKVNNETNLLDLLVTETDFDALLNPLPRKLVIEEYTGIDCGFCPRGYVGMEYMRETYPDDAILIAVHNYGNDPMSCLTYYGWSNSYVAGAPQATANRQTRNNATKDEFIAAYNQIANHPCNAKMELNADYKDDSYNDAVMKVTTTFNEDIDNSLNKYGLAFVVTEDNVGPYMQLNYYSGGSQGAMEGFEDLPSKTPLIYNDVARHIWGWNGKIGSLPAQIIADQENEYNFDITLSDVDDHRNAHVIALLIDREKGEIVTGAKNIITNAKSPEENPNNSVEEIEDDIVIYGTPTGFSISGEFIAADVYSIGGEKITVIDAAGEIELPAGLYIVTVKTSSHTNTHKVMVR